MELASQLLPIDIETLELDMYRTMLLARRLDERMWALNRQGKGHFAVPCAGHEATGVGYALALDPAHDHLAPHHRDVSALLVWGITPRDILCHFLGKAPDPASGGRQMYAHWGSRRLRIFSLSSVMAGHVPHAVGVALAAKYRRSSIASSRGKGDNSSEEHSPRDDALTVTWCGFGDGSSSKGDVHESMNFAAIHKLPIVFCCENNGYAISVPQKMQMAVENVADRAAGYGFPGVVVDGMNPLAVYECARLAVERARCGEGPTLIEAKVYRYLPHTSNDDDTRYRTRQDVEHARARDPLKTFRAQLYTEQLLNAGSEAQLERQVGEQVEDAAAYALAAPELSAEDTFKYVYG
ncbi:MAG: thiamine pyrophosphate-dependent dehydrogenase E1 component subunit alpha [Chloroflexi bacterium]|nr:thiamine pyrophosphate-dependent dehydrogenase E1 component subunit alpha [Chloroflexota bacterium]